MVKKDATFDNDMENGIKQSELIIRRNRPGTSSKDWSKWEAEDLDEMESTLAVQQYIQQLIKKDPSNVELILKAPEQQDEGVWKYEHVRQFCLDLNIITVKLQEECSPSTCSQMTATDQWIFLCAAHKNPKECSAIDYTRHTLDGAACLLNSNRYFPSRVNIKDSSVQKLGSVCRRIYRIFSHAYFHHRHIYDEIERDTSLCKRFTRFVIKYELMTPDSLIVPIEEPASSSVSSSSTSTTSSSSSSSASSTSSSSSSPTTSSSSTSSSSPPSSAVDNQQQEKENTVDLKKSVNESDA